jgi:NADH-quinone oxidoreductase subunit J
MLFYAFGLVALFSALLAVTRKNAISAAMWLVMMFFGLAGIYVVLEAYFVAAVQILVYAGAIMVLFLFVIMLLDLRSEELRVHKGPRFKALGVVGALGFLAAAVVGVLKSHTQWPSAGNPVADLDGGAAAIGEALFTRWLLAFEVTSFLLLGAILGAVLLTKRRLT